MSTPAAFLRRVKKFDPVSTASKVLSSFEETIEDLNREQLLEGKLSTGKDITPSYLDDPYFKSRESAQRYSDWKDRITPNPKRRPGTPNLIVTGPFHRSLDFFVRARNYFFVSNFPAGPDIFRKFSPDVAGLTVESKEKLKESGMKEAWEKEVRKSIYR